jgi:hypothetical protein
MLDRSLNTLLDSDLLWMAMRARSDNVTRPTPESRQIEIDCQHELMLRYSGDSIIGKLVREESYTAAYLKWVNQRDLAQRPNH